MFHRFFSFLLTGNLHLQLYHAKKAKQAFLAISEFAILTDFHDNHASPYTTYLRFKDIYWTIHYLIFFAGSLRENS